MNFADYLLEIARDEDAAVVTNEAAFSFSEIKRLSANIIAEFVRLKIQPGDRVGLLGLNSPFWVAAYLAIIKYGAVAAPLSTVLSADDLRRNIEFVSCKLVLIDRAFVAKYAQALSQTLHLCSNEIPQALQAVDWPAPAKDFDPDSDAALMFTSGTTSRPRAVRITHANLKANTESIIQYLALNSSDRMMAVLPFYYCFGASLLHTHLRVGGSIVLGNSFAYPETILDLMEKTRCTGFAGVPSTYQILLRNSTFPNRALPDLAKIQQAGGKLHNALLEELIRSHPGAQVFVMYGQTEATARLSYLPPEFLSTKLGSIGKGIPGVKLEVFKEGDLPVEPGEIGEIIACGENISPGYFDDPEASSQKFNNGRLRTGDLATVDADGYIYIVDRKDDFIKSYGHRISSYEVESCVLQISDVVAAAAVGAADDLAGEVIVVFAVLRTGSTCTASNISAHCRSSLPRHMVPKEVIFVPSLPMNAHGKVVKAELKKRRVAA